KRRRRYCKMFHGVSSFWRRQTAFLNVLQSGAYANSPIFHQPCDTTKTELRQKQKEKVLSKETYEILRQGGEPQKILRQEEEFQKILHQISDYQRQISDYESWLRGHTWKMKWAGYVFNEYRYSFSATEWFQRQIVKRGLGPTIGLAEMITGLTFLGLGLVLRRKMAVEALPAYTVLIWLSSIVFLGGLAFMDLSWPKSWFNFSILSKNVPPTSFLLLILSASAVLLAAKIQSRVFIFIGLLFTSYSLWVLGIKYIPKQPAWPIAVLCAGLLVIVFVVTSELRRRPAEEIDPIAKIPGP
ncbi:MAG: hypothetical protein QF511_10625, partial [Rhodospirillales bacterium]|nr:hypothetical protein [Rhodospirillales bacterium]